MDTGASISICSKQNAINLNLVEDVCKPNKNFAGLSNLNGCAMKKVMVKIGSKSNLVRFYRVDKQNLPVLFSKRDLKAMKIQIWFDKDILVDGENNKQLCHIFTAEEENENRIDKVTQRRINATDEQLIEAKLKVTEEKSSHLKDKHKVKMKELFLKYKTIWIKQKLQVATSMLQNIKFKAIQ